MTKLKIVLGSIGLLAVVGVSMGQISGGSCGTATIPCYVTGGSGGISSNITQWDSINLGAPSAYGTSPGAVTVPGVNAFITNTPAVSAGASKHLVSSTLTKISGGGTYTSATTTAPETICLFASVTACSPMTMTVSATASVTGNITQLNLMKSTTGATGATFRIYAYQAAPTLTGVFNTSTYLALLADITSGAYLGSWECTSQIINTDNSYYSCTSNNPSGNNAFNLTDGILRFVILATGAYVSGSSETFNVTADLLTSVP